MTNEAFPLTEGDKGDAFRVGIKGNFEVAALHLFLDLADFGFEFDFVRTVVGAFTQNERLDEIPESLVIEPLRRNFNGR